MKLISKFIKQQAQKSGFALCGIAKAEILALEKERFEKALDQNYHAGKKYLERDIEKRFHPELLLQNCKSVVVCGFNYNMQNAESRMQKGKGRREKAESRMQNAESTLSSIRISRYEQIKDYHIFMKEKLNRLVQSLKEEYGDFNYKITVDTSTISEKAWAVKSGIGYYGKNGIIQTKFGSFVFLGTILMDREVDEYDVPTQQSCENCVACITACPTQAIVSPYQVDSNLCITYINQNNKEPNIKFIEQYGWVRSCDTCQDVCPNNLSS